MTRAGIAIVTGGAGFIGSHMVDLLLERGFEVRVVDNLVGGRESNLAHHARDAHLSFEKLDVRDLTAPSALFERARFVFHFAGIGDIETSACPSAARCAASSCWISAAEASARASV